MNTRHEGRINKCRLYFNQRLYHNQFIWYKFNLFLINSFHNMFLQIIFSNLISICIVDRVHSEQANLSYSIIYIRASETPPNQTPRWIEQSGNVIHKFTIFSINTQITWKLFSWTIEYFQTCNANHQIIIISIILFKHRWQVTQKTYILHITIFW